MTSVPRLFLCFLLMALITAGGASAQPTVDQPPDVEIELNAGARSRIRLALPAMTRSAGMTPAGEAAAKELEQTILDDLSYSGIFDVQDQQILSVLELTGDRAEDFPMYRSLGNQVILTAEIAEAAGKVVLEARVLDLANFRSACQGKRFRGTYSQARKIAHTYSDEVVTCFSGRRGLALTSIVFSSNRGGNKEILIMDYDGQAQRALSGHKSISLAPAWSPAGDGLAYVSYFSGHPSIYWVELSTGQKTALIEDGQHNFSPSFSPDGRDLVFTRSTAGNAEIFSLRRGENELKQLTTNRRIDANPAWSPNGREIAFTSDRSGAPHLYVMDIDGGNVRRLSREGTNNDGAAWHPDGNRLAYAHRHERGNRFDIAVIDVVTLENKILTAGPGSHEAPSFSPDGQRIVFESTRGGNSQIWVIDAGGGNQRRLTSEGENFAPAWSGFAE